MSLQQAAATALAGLATAAYLDARFLIRNDLKTGSAARAVSKATQFVASEFARGKGLIYDYFEQHALGSNASNIFMIFEDRQWTYAEFYGDVQRVRQWLADEFAVRQDEIVALDGPNTPEYVMIQLALNALGAASAYINHNLTAGGLEHCVKLCRTRILMADREVEVRVRPSVGTLEGEGVRTVFYDEFFMRGLPAVRGKERFIRPKVAPTGVSHIIYTSGTTGLPKGVTQSRAKELIAAQRVSKYLGLKPGVRTYTCLPLYHVSAQNLCTVPSIYAASTVVLSRKFSHKTFWPEVRASQAEIVQYVGELARYLLNAPPSALDKQHNVRMVWGNGIRPDVWEPFRQRFGIDTINEIYGATDGFATCWNANRGGFGRNAIAIRGPIWHLLNGAAEKRIRIDVDTEEVLRDPRTGFAIACQADEAGETIHKVDPAMAATAFEKYYGNSEAGLKRRIRDVFEKGDIWFRTGDLLREDAEGRLFFVDRLGDTFRWRSENVATNEVADVFGQLDQIAECNVYGVKVPHADGRAGCAAIVLGEGSGAFDAGTLAKHALERLPRYAVPLFIRVVKEMDYTATNKMQKGKLKAEGIDVERIAAAAPADILYWLPPGADVYVPYGQEHWTKIKNGDVRL